MNGWSIPPLMMASINAYVAVHYLVICVRTRRSREFLSFAHLALAVSLYDTACAFLYNASSSEIGRPWQLVQTGALTFGAIALLVFVADYTRRRPGRFVTGMCVGYSLVLLAAIIGGFRLLITDVPLVKHMRLPLGLSVTYHEMALGPLSTIHDLICLGVFVYIFMAGMAQYRAGERGRAQRLLAATGPLFVAALNDAALGLGLIRSVYLIEYAFMGIVLLMADALSKELVRVARIDETLRQSERNYREVFDATGDAILVHDATTGAILDVNKTMLDLFGYTRDEALQLATGELSAQHPLYTPREAESRIRRAIQEGPQVFEWLSRRKNGEEFLTEVALKSCSIGGEGRVLAVVRDISERKLAESLQAAIYEISEVAQQETKLEELFVALHRIVGRLMNAKNLYVALYDPAADLVTFPYFVDEEDQPPPPRRPRRGLTEYILRTGKPLLATPEVFEELCHRGEVESIGAPSIDWLGVPLAFGDQTLGVIVVQTYTEGVRYGEREKDILTFVSRQVALAIARKRAEEALRESEARFQLLAEVAPVGIFRTDKNGATTYVNQRWTEISGLTAQRALGDGWLQAVHPEDRDGLATGWRDATVAQHESRADYRFLRPDGTVAWVVGQAVTVLDAAGQFAGYAGTITDITGRKLTESLQAAIYEISEVAQQETTLEELFVAVHGIIGRLMNAKNLYVALYDPAADLLTFPYFVDEEDQPAPPRRPGRGLTEYILRTGKALLATPEVFEDLARRGEVESLGAPSIDWLGVPLAVGDQTLGAIVVQTYTEGVRYGEREKDILTFVSRQVALAIARKRAEQELQRSEQDYRSVVENAREAIIISQEGVLLYVSPSTLVLSGYPESELLGKPFLGFVHADDRDMVLSNYKRRMQGLEVPEVYELRLTTKSGEVKWAANSAVVVSWGGKPAVLHFLTDVTERKRVEDALRESEQFVRSVLDAMVDAVIITGPEGNVLFANPAAARLANLPWPLELGGISVLDFVHPDDLGAARRDLAQMEAGAKRSPGRYRLREAANQERWIETLGTTIRFRKEPAYLFTVRDITERMHLEVQLRQAQKMEAVGRLAGGIAHDFNNVLQALLSLSQALPSQLTDPVRFGATALELQEQVKRGAALTRQLLLFSRQEARRLERLDLNQVVRQFSQMMRLVRENVWVSLELGEGAIPVMGDRGQLEQVLMNLVVNAADAMPLGGRLTIRTRIEDGGAILEVMDTGTGMTEEIKARLFEPFFTTKEASKGTGLGLSVVHGIVTSHGGRVEAESVVDRGSTFRVVLPVPTGTEAVAEPRAGGDRARLAVGGGERVLVVEDEAGAREGLQQVLTMLGYRVTAVGSGAEADAVASEPGFDLLLTDYLLPDVLGTDLAVRLRSRWPAVKVVLMSGYAEDEAVRKRISQGEVRFLQKPFDMTSLARELHNALADGSIPETR